MQYLGHWPLKPEGTFFSLENLTSGRTHIKCKLAIPKPHFLSQFQIDIHVTTLAKEQAEFILERSTLATL